MKDESGKIYRGTTIGDVLKAVGKLPIDPPKPTRWLGEPPTTCDVCHGTLGRVFYDAHNPQMRQWGIHCHPCFTSYKCKLGTGLGQKYNRKTLEKVAG